MGQLDGVQKKIREADFFLSNFHALSKRTMGDHEHAEFFLNAFANSAYSIEERIEHIYESQFGEGTFNTWRKNWRQNLPQDQRNLIEFFVVDRGAEVHGSGTSVSANMEMIPYWMDHDLARQVTISQPPMPLGVHPSEHAVPKVGRPKWTFTINRNQRDAFGACSEWLRLERKMADDFFAAHPQFA